MGLFDQIVRNVTREATRTLTNAVSDTVSNAVRKHGKQAVFEVKLKEILENAGGYELKNNIAVAEIEQYYGQDAYSRGRTNGYKEPTAISYGIYQNGVCKLYIRLWKEYSEYNRAVNREVRTYCDQYNIPMLDFFEYLPNEFSYVKNRIESYL